MTTLALALGPYAAFDIPLRSGDEMLHLHSLQVLSWPAFSAVAVALFGSARDLREGELSVARQMIVRLRDELAIVQKAADAALDALKRNEAEIAMRRDITPLMVIKALNRLGKSQPASFARDLAHVLRLIAPAADFALLSEDGEAIAASGSIRTSTLDQMRRCILGALENGSKVSPAVRKALDSDARKILTLRVTGEPGLVLCVTCASSHETEEIADYLPEVGDAIGQTARKLVPKRPRKWPSREVA
ncbi:hypothetical protein [Citreimonas salinaria]|uniref:hypothetical protein n=1 Tax=Citreimonas salinaria TaxID=321339 RepID=UPI00115FCC8F|nr:hypothetical protein [Citreimonas salinaria]